jgi:1,4-alpha-glucan branching enzyme
MTVNLTAGGATFRVWAPEAQAVSLQGSFNGWTDQALQSEGNGYWQLLAAGAKEGDHYKFYVKGHGSEGHKRDPYARALSYDPPWPGSNCLITNPETFPWHDAGFRTPPFENFIVYQLHIGTFYGVDEQGGDTRRTRVARFFDVFDRIEYLADLGVTAIQLLPVQEFTNQRSLGYNGTDYFSPEMDYTVPPGHPDFVRGVDNANALLNKRGLASYAPGDLDCQTKQLMALVDICHVYGIAVIFDVVYNHAGGDFGGSQTTSESLYFLDRQQPGSNNNSLYFTDQGWSGGLVFAYWKLEVRQFLIDNAAFFFREYHVDAFRFDEVTVIGSHGGWEFLQHLTDTLRYIKPEGALIAEYWDDQSAVVRPRNQGGAGFDMVVSSQLRNSLRGVLGQAAGGASAYLDWGPVAQSLYPRYGSAWRDVHHVENHDVVRINNETDRAPRIAAAAGGNDPRSWYARSRSRVINGLLLTAPGMPALFMGQEMLEDKYWSDNPSYYDRTLVWWDGLQQDRAMQDHLRFTRELIWLRRNYSGLRGDRLNVFHAWNDTRVLAFHRWVEGSGHDIVVVASLNETTQYGYELGFPRAGEWREIFNSDIYDHWVNPMAAGNGGRIQAYGPGRHGLPASALVTLPANGLLIFSL